MIKTVEEGEGAQKEMFYVKRQFDAIIDLGYAYLGRKLNAMMKGPHQTRSLSTY